MLKDERFISKMIAMYNSKPIQMYTPEELQGKKYNLNQVYIGKIIKYHDVKRLDNVGNIVQQGMILVKLQDRMYLDLETGKCYKSFEYFEDENFDSNSKKLKLVATKFNKESNVELTISQIRSIANRSKQFSK